MASRLQSIATANRSFVTHCVISAGSFAVAHNDLGKMTARSPNAYSMFRIRGVSLFGCGRHRRSSSTDRIPT